MSISLEEAYHGKKQDIKFSTTEKCGTCKGNGSKPGSSPETCSYCGGNGRVRSNQGFFTVQQTCPQCNVMVMEKKLQIRVEIVMVKEKHKPQKKLL